MKITLVQNGTKTKAYSVQALLGTHEFEQLQGSVSEICAFATKTISRKTSYTKTGSRHNMAKYLLLPAVIRKQIPLSQYDFNKLTCGTACYKNNLYVIYKVPNAYSASLE